MPADSAAPAHAPLTHEGGLVKGASIGRYVVLGLIGRGGMGEVYAAYDPELDRKIAIKLLKTRDAAAADGRTRLLREAQAIARLSHPNVVVVYDVGTFGESVFIAMEFVEGNTIGYWLEAKERGWREVLDVYMAAGRGLIAAHAAGLVHRDFKPENVMITKSGQVRVMDFGLAREQVTDAPSPAQQQAIAGGSLAAAMADTFEAGSDPDATAKLGGGGAPAMLTSPSGGYLGVKLTQTGAVLGTPAYMAPEQFAGASGDARTDQFSFCVALYEGVYRKRPFAGNNVIEIMANVVGGTISDPPDDARVPGWIRKVLLRGLRVAPGERHESMTALLAALARDPAVRRRRWFTAAAGLALLAGATGGAYRVSAGQHAMCAGGPARAAAAWGADRRAAIERAFNATGNKHAGQAFSVAAGLFDRYVANWTGMYKEVCEATHARGEQSADVLDLRMACLGERLSAVRAVTDVLATADAAVVDNAVNAASSLPTLDRCNDVPMLRAVIRPPDDPGTRQAVAAVREEVAKVNALAMSGQCDAAAKIGPLVVNQAKALAYRPLVAEALYALGRLGEACVETTRAVAHLEESAFVAQAVNHDEIGLQSAIYLNLLYLDRVHDLRMGRYWFRHAEALSGRFSGHPRLDIWMLGAKGALLRADGRLEEALVEQRRALAKQEPLLGKTHVDIAASVLNIALLLHELGRDAEAEPVIARAVELFTTLFGRDSARLAVAVLDEGEILTELGQYDRARAAFEKALAIWRAGGASRFFIGFGLLDLGRLELAQGRAKEARATLEQAIADLGTEDVSSAAQAQFALAQALWSSPREQPRALAMARQARTALAGAPAERLKLERIDTWLAARRR